jgi:hypothetical protein
MLVAGAWTHTYKFIDQPAAFFFGESRPTPTVYERSSKERILQHMVYRWYSAGPRLRPEVATGVLVLRSVKSSRQTIQRAFLQLILDILTSARGRLGRIFAWNRQGVLMRPSNKLSAASEIGVANKPSKAASFAAALRSACGVPRNFGVHRKGE